MHRIPFQECNWNSDHNSEQSNDKILSKIYLYSLEFWPDFFPQFLLKLGPEFPLEFFFISGLMFSLGAASQIIVAILLQFWSNFLLELCPKFRHNFFMIGLPSDPVYKNKILVGMLPWLLARI